MNSFTVSFYLIIGIYKNHQLLGGYSQTGFGMAI